MAGSISAGLSLSGRVAVVTGDDVRVRYTKYDGSLHWHYTMCRLGEDKHGTWLGSAGDLIARRGTAPPIVIEQAHVLLFPRGVWWTAVFNAEPASTEIYCDITTPARWPDPGEVIMADLDLDVVRKRPDGRIAIVDQDEFAEHQIQYGYPAEVIREAEQAAAWLCEAIRAGTEPFGRDYQAWLDQVR
jgi:protein associated with RNAse G/E